MPPNTVYCGGTESLKRWIELIKFEEKIEIITSESLLTIKNLNSNKTVKTLFKIRKFLVRLEKYIFLQASTYTHIHTFACIYNYTHI